MSANVGEDPTDGYEETFLTHLADARDRLRAFIRAYRLHGEVNQAYAKVYGAIGGLLKFAAYTLGNADGRRTEVAERANLTHARAGHWFEPFFKRLHEACRAIGDQYGRWTDKTSVVVQLGLGRYPFPQVVAESLPRNRQHGEDCGVWQLD